MITAVVKKPSKLMQTLRFSASRSLVAEKLMTTENAGVSVSAEGSKNLCSKIQDLSKYEPSLFRSHEYCFLTNRC